MTRRSRILLFSSAAALVIAGGACAALVEGVTGEVLTIVLIAAGLGGALLLVFLEIGLSEERDLARDNSVGTSAAGGRSTLTGSRGFVRGRADAG